MMRKNVIRLLACAFAVVSVLSLAACGGEKTVSSEGTVSTVSAVDSETEVSSALTKDGKYATVKDFAESDALQSQIGGVLEGFEGNGISLELVGEDNKLIYNFVYDDIGSMDPATLGSALSDALEGTADTFKTIANVLKTAVDVENPVVVVRYVVADGTELCTKEFTAD